MFRLIEVVRRFSRDERGASIVEYALLIALLTVVCLVAMSTLGTSIGSFFNAAATTI